MLIFLGAGVYYVLFSDDEERKYKPDSKYQKQYPRKITIQTKNINSPENTIQAITITPEIQENIANNIQTNIEAETAPPAIESKPIKNETYQADISKIDNEITITLHRSDTKVQLLKPVEPAPTNKTEEAIIEPVTEIEPLETYKKVEQNKIIPPQNVIREVVHTVVKGDTLWAIAKKYVNDPFRYPELARLSNIKNPHRIYPGNQVRIRFIDN
ncbi:MAG: LysM peptidoglycan-binding domain-containing protein [Gammaproteobacteria bacterium]|nr:LysM peptidoglycan-binding domain-containing protein [Gammaproteobacteria bacterium]